MHPGDERFVRLSKIQPGGVSAAFPRHFNLWPRRRGFPRQFLDQGVQPRMVHDQLITEQSADLPQIQKLESVWEMNLASYPW